MDNDNKPHITLRSFAPGTAASTIAKTNLLFYGFQTKHIQYVLSLCHTVLVMAIQDRDYLQAGSASNYSTSVDSIDYQIVQAQQFGLSNSADFVSRNRAINYHTQMVLTAIRGDEPDTYHV